MNFLCVKSIYIFSMAGPQHSICCPGRHLCPSSCTPASIFRFIPGGHAGVLGSSLPAFCTPAHASFFSTGFHFLLLLHAGFHFSLYPRRAHWSSWLLSPRFLHAGARLLFSTGFHFLLLLARRLPLFASFPAGTPIAILRM